MQKSRRWCPECQKNVLAENNPMNCGELMAHGILTLMTLGLWLPVAVIWNVARKNSYRCPGCGHKT